MQAGKVNSITRIENIKDKLDYCEMVIDGFPFKVFCDYDDYVRYIDVTIAFEIRNDVYHGDIIEVVEGIIERKTLVTVSKEEDIKLLPDIKGWTGICNFALASLRVGETMGDCIFYLTDMYIDGSERAKWFQLKVVDMTSKVYEIRMFTSGGMSAVNMEAGIKNFIGSYIKCNVTSTKYGLQTSEIDLYPVDVVEAPEVLVAITIINDAVKDDIELLGYLEQYDFIEQLRKVIDVEPGYHLVRIASEITMIKYLKNISDVYSDKLLIRAAIVSRGYLINRKNELSKPILNVNKLMRSKLASDIELINTIDVLSEDTTPNKRVYIKIRKFVDFVISERRGVINEKDIISSISSLSSDFGWLL